MSHKNNRSIVWFCIVVLMCGCQRPPDSTLSLTQADRDDICELAIKRYANSGGFKSDMIFVALPDGLDPSDDFMSRFRDYQPKAEKASMAYHDNSASRQVRHKATNQAGALVRVHKLTMRMDGIVQVDLGYDMFALGGGNDSLILSRVDRGWSFKQEIRGVTY